MNSLKKIYIIGDSYCNARSDPDGHWPLILANMLGAELLGAGLAGCAWWDVRKCLLEFKNTPEFDQTDFFIICHTEYNRIIGKKPHHYIIDSQDKSLVEFRKHYLELVYNEEFNQWCVQNWLQEINQLLKNKKVIHLSGFENLFPFMNVLDGIKLHPSLIEISMSEQGFDSRLMLNRDTRANHLSQENNQWLAGQLYKICTTYDTSVVKLTRGIHG
jgi:hypothetical protein